METVTLWKPILDRLNLCLSNLLPLLLCHRHSDPSPTSTIIRYENDIFQWTTYWLTKPFAVSLFLSCVCGVLCESVKAVNFILKKYDLPACGQTVIYLKLCCHNEDNFLLYRHTEANFPVQHDSRYNSYLICLEKKAYP